MMSQIIRIPFQDIYTPELNNDKQQFIWKHDLLYCLQLAGVYAINERHQNRIYIGISYDICNRLKNHLNNLESKTHSNIKLQAAYISNEDFQNRFEFLILDIISDPTRDKELKWIKFFLDLGYNLFN